MNTDLLRYIKEGIARGSSRADVEKKLLDAGWPDAEVKAALEALYPAPAARDPALAEEFSILKNDVAEVNRRLAVLERKLGGAPVAAPLTVRETALAEELKNTALSRPIGAPPKQEESIESKITGKWFAGVGIMALVFGVGFFLKYAFENNLIPPAMRVIMGIAAGVAFLFAGDFLSRREKYRAYSFFLSAGGLAFLYLSVYAAYAFYHLVNQPTALTMMIAITVAGAVFSVLSDGILLASLSLVGGFLTPFLVSTGENNYAALLGYVLVLDLGFLAISYWKKWIPVFILNFFGTYAVFFSWVARFYGKEFLWPAMFFLTMYYLIFLTAPFLASIAKKKKSGDADFMVTALNAGVYFATAYLLLKPDYEPFLGFFFAGWAAAAMGLAYIVSLANADDARGVFALGGVGLVLATVAVPIQLHSIWITIAWAAEAVVMTLFGITLRSRGVRYFAYGVFLIAVSRLLGFDFVLAASDVRTFTLVFNERFMTSLAVIAALFASAAVLRSKKDALEGGEAKVAAVMGVAANFIAVVALSMESQSFFNAKTDALYAARTPTIYDDSGRNAAASGGMRAIRNQANLALSIIWGLYAALLMVVGIVWRFRSARILAIAGFAIVVFKVFLYDVVGLSDIYRILSFITLGVILLVISFLFYKYKDEIKEFILAPQ